MLPAKEESSYKQRIRYTVMFFSYQIGFFRILAFLWRWSSFYNFETMETCVLSLYSIVLTFICYFWAFWSHRHYAFSRYFKGVFVHCIMHNIPICHSLFFFSIILSTQLPSIITYQSCNNRTVKVMCVWVCVCVCVFVPKFENNSYFGRSLPNLVIHWLY